MGVKMTHFETETCSRCQGSGNYSFCERYGTRCFKCAGAGKVLSKRGTVARAHFIELCTVKAESIQIGDKVHADGITHGGALYSYVGTVTAIEKRPGTKTVTYTARPDGSFYVSGQIQFDDGRGASSWGTTERAGTEGTTSERFTQIVLTLSSKYGQSQSIKESYRVYRSDDKERLAVALAFQATLTKSGTARKNKSKVS
jgi:hypothetical protein